MLSMFNISCSSFCFLVSRFLSHLGFCMNDHMSSSSTFILFFLEMWLYRILDNLPVAVPIQRRDGSQGTTYKHGFPVGFKGNYAGVSFNVLILCLTLVCLSWLTCAYLCRAKMRNISSITTWASESCIIKILRRILLVLLVLRLPQAGFALFLPFILFKFFCCID